MPDRWISLTQLVAETGESKRNLQYIKAQEPGVLVTREGKRGTEYQQPACSVALRNRAVERKARELEATDFEKARSRKMAAEARITEHDLADREKRSIPTELHISRMRERLESVAGAVKTLHRFRADMLAVDSDAAAKLLVDRMIDETLAELHGLSDVIE